MGYNGRTGQAAQPQGSSLLIGILIGIMLGLAIAGGVAWYLQKSPGQFVDPEKPLPEKTAATVPAPAPAPVSGVNGDKPRFEFYKVLTDKQDATLPALKGGDKPGMPGSKLTPEQAQQAAAKEIYYLQAGSFSNADDADKLKAKLAMLGMEASVQIATIPDKGVWHRVRLGPYKGADEMNSARAALKQNGVEAAPMRAQ